jgi:hypothetical protein
MAGMVEFDGDPRRRRRGRRRRRCSGGERWPRSCAREPVSHWEHVDTINRKNGHWIKGIRRRPMRRRRGRTPASVGEALWWTREPMNRSDSFRTMMWCWLGYRGGLERLRAALRRGQSFSGNWGGTVGCRARASHGEACAGVDLGRGELVTAAHERAVRGRSGGRRRRGNAARTLGNGRGE